MNFPDQTIQHVKAAYPNATDLQIEKIIDAWKEETIIRNEFTTHRHEHITDYCKILGNWDHPYI